MSTQAYNTGQPRDQHGRWAGFSHATPDGVLDDNGPVIGDIEPNSDHPVAGHSRTRAEIGAVIGDTRSWTEIEDQIGADATGRLFKVSSGLAGAADRIQAAYDKAGIDHTSEPGSRTLLLPAESQGYTPVRARLLMPGDHCGQDDCLVYGEDGDRRPVIEFYDTRYPNLGPAGRGQFIAGYYTDTLDEGGWSDGDTSFGAGWKISATSMGAARLWAAEEMDRRTPSEGLIPANADQLQPPF